MTEDRQHPDDHGKEYSPALGEWTRRGLMGTAALAGLSGIAAADQHNNKGGAVYNWEQDVDAQGHGLHDLGSLSMTDNPDVAVRDLAGENLSVDDDGVLNASGGGPDSTSRLLPTGTSSR